MRELFTIDLKNYDPSAPKFIRPSVRGVILCEGKVALVYSALYNYYKFPGGGIDAGETHAQTLIREVAEETGLIVKPETIREYGLVHRISGGDRGDIFVQDNFYYLCEAERTRTERHLDEYEAQEGFTLRFMDPAEAIAVNRAPHPKYKNTAMLEREALVLERLIAEGLL